MKKVLCLILVLTVLVCAHVSALADLGYVSIKTILNKSLEGGFSATVDKLPDDSTVLLMFVFGDNDYSMTLFGKNSKNECEGTLWQLESAQDMLVRFLAVCMSWDSFEECMRPGYKLQFAYVTEDNYLTINSADEAEMAVAVFYDTLESE